MRFFVRDYLCDPLVRAMNYEQRGTYSTLLFVSWDETPVGTIPCDDDKIAAILGVPLRKWLKNKEKVLAPFCFDADSDGRWLQKRVVKEYEVACLGRERCSEGGKKGAGKRWGGYNWKDRVPITESNGVPIARASASASSLSVSEGENLNVSLPKRPDPNTFVPSMTATPSYIDRKKPPFPDIKYWDSDLSKTAVRSYLAHVEEKFGWVLTEREFRFLIHALEKECPNAKAIERLVIKTIKSGWKQLHLPSETGEKINR